MSKRFGADCRRAPKLAKSEDAPRSGDRNPTLIADESGGDRRGPRLEAEMCDQKIGRPIHPSGLICTTDSTVVSSAPNHSGQDLCPVVARGSARKQNA